MRDRLGALGLEVADPVHPQELVAADLTFRHGQQLPVRRNVQFEGDPAVGPAVDAGPFRVRRLQANQADDAVDMTQAPEAARGLNESQVTDARVLDEHPLGAAVDVHRHEVTVGEIVRGVEQRARRRVQRR